MRTLRILSILLILTTITSFAQSAGNSGLSFLKYGFGARNIGMADAGAVASNDLTALFYNPARLAGTDKSEVLFMHNEWIEDIRSEVIGAKTEIFDIPFALGFNVTSVSDIPFRTIPGEPESMFSANYFFGSLSTGFFIMDDLSVGGTFKYLYEGILNDEANGFGFDLGVNFDLPVKGLSASGVVKNLGSMNALRNESTKLPTELRIGSSYQYALLNTDFDFTFAAEYLKYLDNDDNHFNLGAEVLYNKLIALRAGYQTGWESRGFTTGLGLAWGNLRFDYAFLPFSLGIGSANLFSIQFKF